MTLLGIYILLTAATLFTQGCNPPLLSIYEIAPKFPTAPVCQRTFYVTRNLEPGNVRTVSYKAKLNTGETPESLLECFLSYAKQNGSDWFDGVTVKWNLQNNEDITIKLFGQPDPTFKEEKSDERYDQPLKKVMAMFKQMETFNIADLTCNTDCYEDSRDCIHCWLRCPLNGDKRSKETICSKMVDFFNQDNCLENAEYTCEQHYKYIEMDLIGKSKPGDRFLVPRHFTTLRKKYSFKVIGRSLPPRSMLIWKNGK